MIFEHEEKLNASTLHHGGAHQRPARDAIKHVASVADQGHLANPVLLELT
jgi:hypothetical protein